LASALAGGTAADLVSLSSCVEHDEIVKSIVTAAAVVIEKRFFIVASQIKT
jgi:hypothetical protein